MERSDTRPLTKIDIWTDGSSLGNPGPGGWGAVLLFKDGAGSVHKKELSGGFAKTTNNRMELMAPICALEALKRPCDVEIHSDSSYVVNAHKKGWIDGWKARGWKNAAKKPVANQDLWQRLIHAEEHHRVSYQWVKGHGGIRYNERCDELAKEAASRPQLPRDAGFAY